MAKITLKTKVVVTGSFVLDVDDIKVLIEEACTVINDPFISDQKKGAARGLILAALTGGYEGAGEYQLRFGIRNVLRGEKFMDKQAPAQVTLIK